MGTAAVKALAWLSSEIQEGAASIRISDDVYRYACRSMVSVCPWVAVKTVGRGDCEVEEID